MAVISVRHPTVDDADRMAEVHIAAWRQAYRGVMPDEFLDGLDQRRFAANWTSTLTDPASGVTQLVGEVDGVIQGISTVGPFRDRDAKDDPSGELWLINVHPAAFGLGLANVLHRDALDQLRCDGHHRAALWVAEQNPRARRFYEREGWSLDKERRKDQFGGQAVVELRYSISL
jgi:ribosomal protein S18 acetylase RimI-like enzyme